MRLLTFLAGEGTGILDEAAKETTIDGFLGALLEAVYDPTVQLILGLALVLFLIAKGVMIGMKIVKAADDTSARKEAIDSLKFIILGVIVVAVLYYGSGAVVRLFFDF